MTFRYKYWSCSKLADIIRGTPKMKSGTLEEWNEWDKKSKLFNPIRFWLAEEGLNLMQDFLYTPYDTINDIKSWWSNFFIYQPHRLTTDLKRGKWHEFDERLLHGMFEDLLDFVEIEKAMNNWGKDRIKPMRWWNGWFSKYRSQRDGLSHLLWETTLINDEQYLHEEGSDDYGKPTYQALRAMETLELYVWWKYIRPMRESSMDASGYTEYFRRLDDENKTFLATPKTEEDHLWIDAASAMNDAFESYYEEEDTEMMKRLVELRGSLWT